MKIHRHPTVLMLAKSMFIPVDDWRSNDTENHLTPMDELAEVAGRACYLSFNKGRKRNVDYLTNILRQQHESVLEHGSVTFKILGISRSCSHELIRHRHLSYSQTSQRYVTDPVEFVVPPNMPEEMMSEFVSYCRNTGELYKEMIDYLEKSGELEGKKANEVARFMLPNCTATNIVVTGNIRAWRHFCIVRGGAGADAEIRRLACVILDRLKWIAPNSLLDLEVKDGYVRKNQLT
jgi:thymidylate synthase (FAD)